MNLRIPYALCALLFCGGLWAQVGQSDPRIFTGNGTDTYTDAPNDFKTQINIGGAMISQYNPASTSQLKSTMVGFPYGALYIPFTFIQDKFTVSKGYFGDKIELNWEVGANGDRITAFKIYRKLQGQDDSQYQLIKTVAKDVYGYDDPYVTAGTLYEYRVEALGVSAFPDRFVTFMEGIGFRNPTATVSGTINFDGGTPVQDVVVYAEALGGGNSTIGRALNGNADNLHIDNISDVSAENLTLQFWTSPRDRGTGSERGGRIIRMVMDDQQDINLGFYKANNGNAHFLFFNYFQDDKHYDFVVQNSIPNGEVDGQGRDVLIPIASLTEDDYLHLSLKLQKGEAPKFYVNGRPMTEAYRDQVNSYLPNDLQLFFEDKTASNTLQTIPDLSDRTITDVIFAEDYAGDIDEIRLWKTLLPDNLIRRDYRRYLSGGENGLFSYLRLNEADGEIAYDLSKQGFNFNNHNGRFVHNLHDEKRTNHVPSLQQLGYFGITDANGSYIISAIPYSGNGESFNITPALGVHQFEPATQTVFLGQGSEVINQLNFKDISSFSFKGRVLYDTRGIFPKIAGDDIASPDIDEVGYNQYEINGVRYQKGEWWRNDNGTDNDPTDDFLEHYATIYSEGVSVYVDGEAVLDANNIPVVTDNQGFFDVQVPIGNHYISIGKPGHNFGHEGRFPAAQGTVMEFFEDSNQPQTFVNTTRLTMVGRVVGGSVEAEKPIGFGAEGTFTHSYDDAMGNAQDFTISSKNNIGSASITLGYTPPSGAITNLTRKTFTTNEHTGEYRIEVLPLNYLLESAQLLNNTAVNLPGTAEPVTLFDIPEAAIPQADVPDNTTLTGEPYHLEKSIIYRSAPVLSVLDQTWEDEIIVDGDTIATTGFQYPVYKQFKQYRIKMNRIERYANYDNGLVNDSVPLTDGEFVINNNLALAGSEQIEADPNNASLATYSFQAGLPNISSPFTRNINIKYRVNGVEYEAENYAPEGIILGGQSDGSQTFVTAAPDVPDIILRDPPGSNSFASIDKGETITFTSEQEVAATNGMSTAFTLKTGVTFKAGGGLAGPVIESESTDNIETGIGVTNSSNDGETITKSYSFSQTISTSANEDFVGAEGDLYIGNSKNYLYGAYDNVEASDTDPGNSFALNNGNETLYISRQKAMYFVEEPSETFFVYSQKHLLETLIPELQTIVDNYDQQNPPPPLAKEEYEQQISLWRKFILNNERSKYLALADRDVLRNELNDVINNHRVSILDALNGNSTDSQERILRDNLDITDNMKALFDRNFEDNISFDAGVGSLSRSVESSVINQTSTQLQLTVDASLALQLGAAVNDFGFVLKNESFLQRSISSEVSEEEASTTTISYTLQDNDPANFLSVDIVNTFNGFGPIFSVVGGRTSCPYEGAELSHFYDHDTYDPNAMVIDNLPEQDREEISAATQRVEVPGLSVEVADVSNVPDSQNAEFVLILENNSISGTDANFILKVDNTTNPNNAIINIDPNGTTVSVPYGEQVPYALTLTKSVSDVYEYEDIRIVLESQCDGEDVSDEVLISATFVPSCSSVEIGAPLENWVFNRDAAYNIDGSSNALPITLQGYNLSFNSFQKIDLEYRLATSPNWIRLHTYYTTPQYYNDAQANGETEIALITNADINYAFDIVGAALQDGQYELRARTSCVNGTDYISEPVLGTVDLNSPRRFNTPSPQDGILASGDDIKVSFNEPIFYNSALSQISIKGRTNQLPINNSVSLLWDGTSNAALIERPDIVNGDLSIEFWMKNETLASQATVLQQEEGLEIRIENGTIVFEMDGVSVQSALPIDALFHHYTFTYDNTAGFMAFYLDDTRLDLVSGLGSLQFTNSNNISVGGNSFAGNIHDLRIWKKPLTLAQASANIYTDLVGNERNLIGYWPMNEGRGAIANDLARANHMTANTGWDIKPKGESYEFASGQYQTFDNVDFVQLSDEMDATISFWLKGQPQNATIFSNGRGDGTDLVQANGLTNKWAINMDTAGQLHFLSEGNSYLLTSESVGDGLWHHVAVLINRNGTVRSYIDGTQRSSNPASGIGGFSGNNIWLGARGHTNALGISTTDHTFSGKLDEFRLWSSLRNVEQINRDRYNEVDPEAIGLLLYASMNAPDPVTGKGPIYHHLFANGSVITSAAVLNSGTVNYALDTPPIKPAREVVDFQVNYVINGDEMILEPVVADLASIEGQILDITVHRMFDAANNRQVSPITWTAFVNKNDVSWFVPGFGEITDITKETDEDVSFTITLLNKGGNNQPYAISNIPQWLELSRDSGVLAPDSSIDITVTVSNNLSAGEYVEDLFLETNFGFDQKLQLKVKVLSPEPEWDVNPEDYTYSMNLVGKIRVDGIFSNDSFDKIGAFVDGEVRGSADLVYDPDHQEYFTFLNIYSNENFGETVSFRIWDASRGSVLHATVNGEGDVSFAENEVLGTFSNPMVFDNTGQYFQQLQLNSGWSWVSFNLNDVDFQNVNSLTKQLSLKTSDRILSHSPSLLETYYKHPSNSSKGGWSGTISANGGISTNFMYKVYVDAGQPFSIEGLPVDLDTWSFNLQENWNWLPYPFRGNHSVNEALALFNAEDGDVVKSQGKFAIYDPISGWNGTLTHLEAGKGYMISSHSEQTFAYPSFLNTSAKLVSGKPKSPKGSAISDVTPEAFARYAENMNAVVQLPEGYTEVFVYDEKGILKGKGKVQPINDTELGFVTVYGELEEKLVFHIGDGNSNKATSKTFDFKGNAVLGTVSNPVILEEAIDYAHVFPNPFSDRLTLLVTADASEKTTVRLYNLSGQVVFTQQVQLDKGSNEIKMSPNIAIGTYLLHMNMNGKTVTVKVIKKQ